MQQTVASNRSPASSAWPKVWPRLSSARTPCSVSSSATIAALAAQLFWMACALACTSPAQHEGRRWFPASRRRRHRRAGRIWRLQHSLPPARARQGLEQPSIGKHEDGLLERRRPGSCPGGVLMPVLPPTDESTWASSVVGIWMKSTPRRRMAAAKPVRSPMTPPPKATIVSRRSMPPEQLLAERGKVGEALGLLARRQDDGR